MVISDGEGGRQEFSPKLHMGAREYIALAALILSIVTATLFGMNVFFYTKTEGLVHESKYESLESTFQAHVGRASQDSRAVQVTLEKISESIGANRETLVEIKTQIKQQRRDSREFRGRQ